MRNPEYIGDGVYVYSDGYGIELRANHHETPTDRIYLEPEVLERLYAWAKARQAPQEPIDMGIDC